MIELRELTYCYPHSAPPALEDINLSFAAGDFVLLSGESGAGKSTLLRVLNGLVPHFSGGQIAGSVRVAGLDPITLGPQRLSREVGFVFQSPESQAVLDRVEPEIAFPLENAAVPPHKMRERVEAILSLLGLEALRQRPLRQLSGGERQKVAIGTALAFRPRVLVLDEPTSQLDPETAADFLRAVVRLNREHGLTVLLAEHRLERVLAHASRLVHLADGRVVADGPPAKTIRQLPRRPPIVALGEALGWQPLPLTVAEARPRAAALSITPAPAEPVVERDRPILAVRDLSFAYGKRPVLRDVTLDVFPGEIVALLGRNGSGKSTLLRCLIGLLQPDKGDIRLLGRTTAGRPVSEICRHIAYLPQNPDDLLYADSVAGELRATLANHGRLEAAVDPLLQRLGLLPLADHYPRDLSVGQRQRVALGAVAVTEPPLFLLDEPTRGLDYGAKAGLATLWQGWREAGRGLVVVTHDVELVAAVADRVVILGDEGRVIVDAPPAAAFRQAPHLAPQMARLFPGAGRLTVPAVLAGLPATVQLGERTES